MKYKLDEIERFKWWTRRHTMALAGAPLNSNHPEAWNEAQTEIALSLAPSAQQPGKQAHALLNCHADGQARDQHVERRAQTKSNAQLETERSFEGEVVALCSGEAQGQYAGYGEVVQNRDQGQDQVQQRKISGQSHSESERRTQAQAQEQAHSKSLDQPRLESQHKDPRLRQVRQSQIPGQSEAERQISCQALDKAQILGKDQNQDASIHQALGNMCDQAQDQYRGQYDGQPSHAQAQGQSQALGQAQRHHQAHGQVEDQPLSKSQTMGTTAKASHTMNASTQAITIPDVMVRGAAAQVEKSRCAADTTTATATDEHATHVMDNVNVATGARLQPGNTVYTPFVGDTVLVQSRTWSGLNKEGGTGRVLAVNESSQTCDVKYVLEARRECGISWQYVRKATLLTEVRRSAAGRTSSTVPVPVHADSNLTEFDDPCGVVAGCGVESTFATTMDRVAAWIATGDTAVLHLDSGIVNKLDTRQLAYLLREIETQGVVVQVAYLQGARPLEEDLFSELLTFVRRGDVWALNLGEISFVQAQLEQLEDALRESACTHMFYEVDARVGAEWKDTFRDIIRENRKKHQRWALSSDMNQNSIIARVGKCWFNPLQHKVNQEWLERHQATPAAVRSGQVADLNRPVLPVGPTDAALPSKGARIEYKFDDEFEPGLVQKRTSGKYYFTVLFDTGDRLVVKCTPKTLGDCWRYEPLRSGSEVAYRFDDQFWSGTVISRDHKHKHWWLVNFKHWHGGKVSVRMPPEEVGNVWHFATCVKARGDRLVWTQCLRCGKWRRLEDGMGEWPSATFYCEMNTWDERFNACDKEQEDGAESDDEEPKQKTISKAAREAAARQVQAAREEARQLHAKREQERLHTEDAFFMKDVKPMFVIQSRSGRKVRMFKEINPAPKPKQKAKQKDPPVAQTGKDAISAKDSDQVSLPAQKKPRTLHERKGSEDAFFVKAANETVVTHSRSGRKIRTLAQQQPQSKTQSKLSCGRHRDQGLPVHKAPRTLKERKGSEDAFFVKAAKIKVATQSRSGRTIRMLVQPDGLK